MQADVDALKATLENAEATAEEIQAGVTKLGESSQKMGAAMYAAAEADQAAAGGTTGATGEADDDVVDAEIVDEEPPSRRVTPSDRRSRRGPRREPTRARPHPAARRHRASVDDWLEEGAAARGGRRPRPERRGPTVEAPRRRRPTSSSMAQLAERTADLQRLQAEFLNYKRRVDRDRDLIRENATYAVLAPIIDVLDTIDRAREHGDLDGGFQAVADQLERVVTGLGLTKFGAPGDAVRPEHPRGALPHRRGSRGGGHDLQGDRQGRLPDRRPRGAGRAGAGGRPGQRVGPSRARRRRRERGDDEGGECDDARTDGMRADWATKDFYQVLGVAKDASADEIKKAYRKLARANHPDSNPGDTAKHDRFKAVAEAYDVIGDPEKRKKYDEMRSLVRLGGGLRGGFGGGGGGFDVSDLLRDRRAAAAASATCSATSSAPAAGAQQAPSAAARAPTSRPRPRSASPTPSRASRSRCG